MGETRGRVMLLCRGGHYFNMTDVRIVLRESDIEGAILQCSVIEDNQPGDLRRWLACRVFSSGKSETKASLTRRVKDLIDSGLSRYVCDPDGKVTSELLSAVTPLDVPLPPVYNWTDDLGCLPHTFCHSSIVIYLLHRKLKVISRKDDGSDSEDENIEVPLPSAQKPLRKGYNFFASGHVDEIKTNCLSTVIHIDAKVLSSFKENRYNTKVVLEKSSGAVVVASCSCVGGKGGKCNHIAGLLFALIDFKLSLHRAPESCTSQSQQWHKPPRKSQKFTKPIPAGDRKLQHHEYGRVVKKKRPLEDFSSYRVLKSVSPVSDEQIFQLKRDMDMIKERKHDSGLTQILDSSTDTGSENDVDVAVVDPSPGITLTPEQKALKSLQVIKAKQAAIERLTRGQAFNQRWFQHKKGRVSASYAKRCCGKPTPSIIKAIITVGKPRSTSLPSLMYGVENESLAVSKYVSQVKAKGQIFCVQECGVFVDVVHGQPAASPDRILCDPDGHTQGVLEVKCLYSCREMSPENAVQESQKKSDFPVRITNEVYQPKESHQYYYQVQMQMAVCKVNWCDFILFTNANVPVLITRVYFNQEFWERVQAQLLAFHEENVLPALVAQGFGQS